MVWTAIGLALACAPFVVSGFRYASEFRGDLAGYWYQVTYDPKDEPMGEPCWSIELMRLRHRRDTVKGTWWRIFPEDFHKKWTWEGKLEGAFVIGSYFASKRSKTGGSGNFFMMEIGEGRVKGHFMCVVIEDMASGGVGFEPETWPMEWVRLDRCNGAALAEWVHSLPHRPCDCRPLRAKDTPPANGHAAIDHLPWYGRRALGHSGWPNARRDSQRGLGSAAAASSPLPALALEDAERHAAASRQQMHLPAIPHLRRLDILGKAIRSPRERPTHAEPAPDAPPDSSSGAEATS